MGPILTGLAMAAPSLIGRGLDMIFNQKQQAANTATQKEFAQHGIRWRVEDAKAAGIHPLYALGAQTQSFSPIHVGTDFAGMGQDISRAIDATRTSGERADARLAALTLERAELENDLLRSQILGSKAALLQQVGPAFPGGAPGPADNRASVGDTYWNDAILWGRKPTSRAQDVEDDYGEAVGDTFGFFNWLDTVVNPWLLNQALGVKVEQERQRMGLPVRGVGAGVTQRGY